VEILEQVMELVREFQWLVAAERVETAFLVAAGLGLAAQQMLVGLMEEADLVAEELAALVGLLAQTALLLSKNSINQEI
jgi:hypothetical protein